MADLIRTIDSDDELDSSVRPRRLPKSTAQRDRQDSEEEQNVRAEPSDNDNDDDDEEFVMGDSFKASLQDEGGKDQSVYAKLDYTKRDYRRATDLQAKIARQQKRKSKKQEEEGEKEEEKEEEEHDLPPDVLKKTQDKKETSKKKKKKEKEKAKEKEKQKSQEQAKEQAKAIETKGEANRNGQPPQEQKHAQDFEELKLSRPLLRAINDLGWPHPTPVQAQAIPVALTGKDVLVNAVTGSGKTGAFLLPVLERLLYRPRRVPVSRVLILLPTRELAAQCFQMGEKLVKHCDIRLCLVAGGLSTQAQQVALRARPDVVIATPGRLIDHLRNSQSVHLEDVEVLLLDEADRLLEMGFSDELREIVKSCPRQRQTMLFSATLTEEVQDLINLSLKDPVKICIDPYLSIVDNLAQEFIRIAKHPNPGAEHLTREAIVLALCTRSFKERVIVFVRSKSATHRLAILFGLRSLKAAELHGNLTQLQRLSALENFAHGEVDFLLCTDVAARGLDIPGVQTVINMDVPKEFRQYVHRVGRTARAGKSGRAISLVGGDKRALLKQVLKMAQDVVQSRTIAPPVLNKFRSIIRELEPDVKQVLALERVEKEARLAEMEANKMKNLLSHEQEIMTRPAKTWFQSPAEKKASKDQSVRQFGEKEVEEKGEQSEQEEEASQAQKEREAKEKQKEKNEKKKKEKKKDPLMGLSRKKKRRKMFEMEAERETKAQLKAEGRDEKEYADVKRNQVERMKAMLRQQKAERRGKVAKQKARDEAGPVKKQKKQKKKGDELEGSQPSRPLHAYKTDDDTEAFGGKDRRYTISAASKKRKKGEDVDPQEEKRKKMAKRSGKGKKQFKSKSRHKRR